jgi:hypothetical protein
MAFRTGFKRDLTFCSLVIGGLVVGLSYYFITGHNLAHDIFVRLSH